MKRHQLNLKRKDYKKANVHQNLGISISEKSCFLYFSTVVWSQKVPEPGKKSYRAEIFPGDPVT